MRKTKKAKFTKRQKFILSTMLLGGPIYIKNTGVEVDVERIEKDYYTRSILPDVQVRCKKNPTAEILLLSKNYRLNNTTSERRAGLGTPGEPVFDGEIKLNLEDLSTEPYESRAAKILYRKRKE